jgi:hypothetical protein
MDVRRKKFAKNLIDPIQGQGKKSTAQAQKWGSSTQPRKTKEHAADTLTASGNRLIKVDAGTKTRKGMMRTIMGRS